MHALQDDADGPVQVAGEVDIDALRRIGGVGQKIVERVDVRHVLPQQGQFQLVAAISGLKVDDAVAAEFRSS